jgi:CelD/BcsL family acetyltransferase involved in cellulose biosynthesis
MMSLAPVEVSLIPASERAAIAPVWQRLERAAPDAIAVSWDWTETWLRHYGERVPHRFALCQSEGQPCAVALITSSRRHTPGLPAIRVLHLGTTGAPTGSNVYVEWNRLLALPGIRDQAAGALLAHLRQENSWDELALEGFDPAHAHAFLTRARWTSVRCERSPITNLDLIRDRGADVLDALGAGVRRRLRQSLNAFSGARLEWATDVQQGLEILDELARLHCEGWRRRGQTGAFANPTFSGFHREVVARLLPTGRAILFRVSQAGQTVGCVYCLTEDGRVLFYQGGFARFADNRLRAGLVTHVHCMRACLERGFNEYDFLAGDARYKDELSTGARQLVWASLRRPHLRLAAWRGARAVRGLLGARPMRGLAGVRAH